jgi:RNA polymerase sigma-70 factor (ECF subfamily)
MDPEIDEVVTAWDRALRAYVGRRVRDPHAADDVVQETWLRVHRGLSSLRDGDRIAPWLFRVARSAVVDHLRRRPARAEPLEPSAVAARSEGEDGGDEDAAAFLAACLPGLIEGLRPEDQEVLTAVDAQGRSQASYAREHGLTAVAVRSRTQRARRRLRERLEACCRVLTDRRGHPVEAVPLGSRCAGAGCGAPPPPPSSGPASRPPVPPLAGS